MDVFGLDGMEEGKAMSKTPCSSTSKTWLKVCTFT